MVHFCENESFLKGKTAVLPTPIHHKNILETGLETSILYPVSMRINQAATNRQLAKQLITEPTAVLTAVSLAPTITLQDYARDIVIEGREAVIAAFDTFFHVAFVETAVEFNTLLADNQTATLSLHFSGRQVAPFWGLPCTGRHVTLSLAIIFHFHTDQIAHIKLYYDAGTLLRQLGLAL